MWVRIAAAISTLALGAMIVGTLFTLPADPAAALYRARGLYGRRVGSAILEMFDQLGRASVTLTRRPVLPLTFVYFTVRDVASASVVAWMPRGCFPFCAG